jgi:putative transposase
MNRGAGRRAVFRSDADRAIFLACLVAAARRHQLEIHAYCLLDNHYHLLLRSLYGRLSQAMQFLSSRFTQRINYKVATDGPLFRGRFASVAVESDAHLVQVLRYIHLNPVSAGLVTCAEAWPWSSAAAYASGDRPDWLEIGPLLDMFGPTGARAAYRAYVQQGVDAATRDFYARLGWPWGQTRRV